MKKYKSKIKNKKRKNYPIHNSRKVSKIRKQTYNSIKETIELTKIDPTMKVDSSILNVFNVHKSIPTCEPIHTFSAGKDPHQSEYTEEYVKKMKDEAIIKRAESIRRYSKLLGALSRQKFGINIFDFKDDPCEEPYSPELHKQRKKIVRIASKKQFDLSIKESAYEALGNFVEKQVTPEPSQTLDISPIVEEYITTRSRNNAMRIVEKVNENVNKVITEGRVRYSNAA